MKKTHTKFDFRGALLLLTTVVGILFVSWFATRPARSQDTDPTETPPLSSATLPTPLSSLLIATPQPDQTSTDESNVDDSERIILLCASAHGKIIKDQIYSRTFEMVIPIMVYFPACENPNPENTLAYSSLYLLHGLGNDESQWIELGLENEMGALTIDIAPFMVVMPQVPEMLIWPSDKNATFITAELIPYIDNQYPTLPDRAHRAIGGLSRGAAWALRVGLTHPNLFGKIGLHSLSMYDPETNHWAGMLSKMETSEMPQLFMDSGKSDADLGSMQLFEALLTNLNVPHEFNTFDGDHNDAYWSEHLPIYLERYAKGW